MNTHEKLTLGSLFDGSGGFPLGGWLCGITPVWASEIEPFPIRVTTKRLPSMKHYGDVSKMNGGEIEPVDIITFGSPCQDMSVAGKRAGLDGSRSNLFYESIRIIKEMRCATNGEYPRFIVWENVPGAFSSNKGQDFRSVLEAVCAVKDEDISVPEPPKGKWSCAGSIVADGFSLAWRVLDAQFWGVPQRRRRIFLVADFAGESAERILFKSEGLSRYSAAGFRSWQRAIGSAADCIGATGTACLNDQGGQRMEVTEDMTNTLRAESRHPPLVFENRRRDSRYNGPCNVAQTCLSYFGTGGNNQPLVVETPMVYGICSDKSNSMLSSNPHSGVYEAHTSRTIDANGGNPACNQGGMAVVAFAQNQRNEVRDLDGKVGCLAAEQGMKQQTYVLQGSMIGRKDENGPRGGGVNEGISFTLDATDRHAVAYGIDRATYNQGRNAKFDPCITEEVEPPVLTRGPGAVAHPTVAKEPYYIVRRLTPTECARLQGFPDWWCADLGIDDPTDEDIAFWREVFETHRRVTNSTAKPKTDKQIVKWLKNPHSDAAEYKMWGNGVALPCVYFVLAGIAWVNEQITGRECCNGR